MCRQNTNSRVFELANKEIQKEQKGAHTNTNLEIVEIKPYDEYLIDRGIKLLGHLIRESADEPTKLATFNRGSALPKLPKKRRVGRPKLNWVEETSKEAFKRTQDFHGFAETYDINNKEHRNTLRQAGKQRIF